MAKKKAAEAAKKWDGKTALEGYYTIEEAAKYLGVSKNSAWRQAHIGKLESIQAAGRAFIPKAVLQKFVMPKRGNPNIGKTVRAAFASLSATKKKK